MADRYGLPYKGSKNKLAARIAQMFPPATNFYDLFCGGGAVTHAVLETGKFRRYVMNDIDGDMPRLFKDAVAGKYRDEKRWISRDDFLTLKDTDPYVKVLWSFGNNCEKYLYAKEVEPWKKALHYARVFGDFSLLAEFGIDTADASRISIAKNQAEYKEKYIEWYLKNVLKSTKEYEELKKNLGAKIADNSEKLRAYLTDGLKKANKRPCDVDRFLGTNGMAGHYFGRSQWEFPTREVYIKLQGFLYLPQDYEEIYGLQNLYESLESLQRLQSLESLQRLQSLESLQSLERLETSCADYREVEILPDSVVYCDIPYKDTDEYIFGGFDHAAFYEWALAQDAVVFISSYDMPAGFTCVESFAHRSLLSGTKKGRVLERVFMPERQAREYMRRNYLFDVA